MQLFVVRDDDLAGVEFPVSTSGTFNPESISFPLCLSTNRKGRDDQTTLVCLTHHVFSPDKLHWSFSKPTVGERGRPSLCNVPFDKCPLKIEKKIRQPHRFKSVH